MSIRRGLIPGLNAGDDMKSADWMMRYERLALWAEQDVILADEFRDGNVPARSEPLRVARRAFAALPEGVEEVRYRGD